MPSSISNFKNKLRLPRLFFRKPTQLESVHGVLLSNMSGRFRKYRGAD
jgi:hypothetical protein